MNWLHLARIEIAQFSHIQMPNIASLMSHYHNVPMDFADACLVYLANELGINQIATIDSDFHIYRIDGKYPFRIMIE